MPTNKAEYGRAWRQAHPEYGQRERLMRKFGITLEQYNQMLAEQGGTCAICHAVPGLRRLAVDHDHATGTIRGLLCSECNKALGLLEDDPALLRQAADYLERSR